MSARFAPHLPWLAAALLLAACSLDPQPEPPMSPSNMAGGAGAAGAWVPGSDAGQSGGAAMQDAAFDALPDSPPCSGCAEGKCDAGDCACDQADGGCEADACPCGDADADACSPDAPESDADADNDAGLDATGDTSAD